MSKNTGTPKSKGLVFRIEDGGVVRTVYGDHLLARGLPMRDLTVRRFSHVDFNNEEGLWVAVAAYTSSCYKKGERIASSRLRRECLRQEHDAHCNVLAQHETEIHSGTGPLE